MRVMIRVFWFVFILSCTILPTFAGQGDNADKLHQASEILKQACQIASGIQEVGEYPIGQGMFITYPVREKLKLLNSIARVQAIMGNREASSGTFHTVLQIINGMQDEDVKKGALQGLAEEQAKAGDIERALQTISLIQDWGWRINPLLKIASAQFMLNDHNGARVSLKKAFEIAKKEQQLPSFVTFNIGVAQARIGDIQGAVESLSAVDDLHRMDLLAEVAAAHVRAGNQKDAFEIVARIEENKGKGFVLKKIALAQMEVNPSDGEKTLNNSMEVLKLSGEEEFIIDDIAVAYAIADNPKKAFQIADSIRDDNTKANTLRKIMEALGKEEAPRQTDSYFNQAIQIAKGISDARTRGRAFQYLARLQLVFSDKMGALKTASLFNKESGDFSNLDMEYIAEIQKEAGDSEAAKRTIQQAIRSMNKSGRFYEISSIVRAQIEIGDLEGALKLVEQKGSSEGWALIEIAAAQAKAGDVEGAFQTIRPIQELSSRAEALGRIAEEQAHTGNGPAIELSLKQAFLLAQVIDDSMRTTSSGRVLSYQGTSGFILENVTRKQAKEGDVSAALGVSNSLTLPYLKARAFLGTAEGILDAIGIKERQLIELFDTPPS